MTRAFRIVTALLTAAAIAGCGAGSSSSSTPLASSNGKRIAAVFRIHVPKKSAHGRHARYVSPATQSLVVAISGPSTAIDETLDLVSSPNCSLSLQGTVCSFTFQLLPGVYSASLSAYDNVVPSSGKLLSAAQSVAFTVTPGVANAINLTLSGVPAQIVATPATFESKTDVSGAIDLLGTGARPLLIQALDADGNAIVGPGAPAFSVSQTGGSLGVTLVQPTASAPNTLTVTPPATYSTSTATLSLTASYTGQATNGCAQTGAVCSGTATLQMSELIGVREFNEVEIFQGGVNAPLAQITTNLANLTSIAFDPQGDIIAANCNVGCGNGGSPDLLAIFSPPYTGLPKIVTNGIASPRVLAFDASGNLYVAECPTCSPGGTDSVVEYSPPFSSGSAPVATITTNVSRPQALAFDSLGNLFVANGNGNTVREYAPPFNGASPLNTVAASLNDPVSLALNASNQLFVANNSNNSVTQYASPYSTLLSKIGNGVRGPNAIGLDGSGDLFVANGSNNTVTEYVAPFTNLSIPAVTVSTGVNAPPSLAIDAVGTLFVANNNGTVTQYAPPYTGTPFTIDLSGGAGQLVILP